jgi:adenylate kinase
LSCTILFYLVTGVIITKLILFVGTAGAGKSSVLAKVMDSEKKLKVVNLGSEMLSIMKEKYNTTDRDKIRLLDDKNTIAIRNSILQKIIDAKDDTIIETHASIKQGRRYRPGFSIEELQKVRISAIIYIDATSDEILQRSMKDTQRQRAYQNIAEVDEWRSVNISIISTFAVHLNIPIYIIYNQQGKLEETSSEVKGILHEIVGA